MQGGVLENILVLRRWAACRQEFLPGVVLSVGGMATNIHDPCSFLHIPRTEVEIEKLCDQVYPSTPSTCLKINLDLISVPFHLSEFACFSELSRSLLDTIYETTIFNLARAFPTGLPHVACFACACAYSIL